LSGDDSPFKSNPIASMLEHTIVADRVLTSDPEVESLNYIAGSSKRMTSFDVARGSLVPFAREVTSAKLA
jgi:hypothetical protein